MRLQNTLPILLQKRDPVGNNVTGVAWEDRTWPLVYNRHRLIELCGRSLKGFTRRVRDLDRALFRVLFGLKWAPLTGTPSSSSFPSGHSATAAAGALTLSVLYPPFAPTLVLAGTLVVLSRVYLGVHFPFDVLAGVIIGTATAGVVLAGAGLLA